MKRGDVFTLAGKFKHRTFWQWLTNKPKELQQYKIIDEVTSGGIAEYVPINQ